MIDVRHDGIAAVGVLVAGRKATAPLGPRGAQQTQCGVACVVEIAAQDNRNLRRRSRSSGFLGHSKRSPDQPPILGAAAKTVDLSAEPPALGLSPIEIEVGRGIR
jgi:hypothetical protein